MVIRLSKILWEKIKESLLSVMPITVLVILLAIFVARLDWGIIGLFSAGALMLVFGLSLFTFGTEIAMMPMGKSVGKYLGKSKKTKLLIVLLIACVIGFVITIAEPDLHVLAGQLSADNSLNYTLLLAVAAGVGIFLAVSVIKMFWNIKLRHILMVCYIAMFLIAAFLVPKEFVPLAFDSGGVTTGPITVPFLMAFGIGMAAAKGSKNSQEDSFGTIALCSVGPILAVLILGATGTIEARYDPVAHTMITGLEQVISMFTKGFARSLSEVGIALGSIVAVFVVFQIFALRMPKRELIRITAGFILTYIGLTVFLTGVNVGFMPMGKLLGAELALKSYNYILIPIGIVIGCLIVLAEPAIYILNKQVEEITDGTISRKTMLICLSAGVSLAVGLAMVRVLTGISIWWFLIPCYAISLLLMYKTPPILIGIAFDSGGVASGPMTATFLLPFAMGVCMALEGNVLADAFGLVAFVAMMPIMAIQLLGYTYRLKIKGPPGKRVWRHIIGMWLPKTDPEATSKKDPMS